jgi:hypothetical protein
MGKSISGLVTQNQTGTSEDSKTITSLAQTLIDSWKDQMNKEKLENGPGKEDKKKQ